MKNITFDDFYIDLGASGEICTAVTFSFDAERYQEQSAPGRWIDYREATRCELVSWQIGKLAMSRWQLEEATSPEYVAGRETAAIDMINDMLEHGDIE